MNCDDVRPMLLEYVMEEAPAQGRGEIARHLETCAACSEEAGKLRQTLGTLAQGAAFEEVPQKIRIVAEPADRWMAFWRNPARLAFAASGVGCIAIALLALAHTTVRSQNGDFEIAFGAAAPVMQYPAAAPLPDKTNVAPAAYPALSREEVVKLIAEAVAESEARQSAGTARIVNASLEQAEAKRASDRDSDRREMAESFRYFQAAQVNMWKQQIESQQVMSALVQRTGLGAAVQP